MQAALRRILRVFVVCLMAALAAVKRTFLRLAVFARAWHWLQAFLCSGAAFALLAQTYDSTIAGILSLPRTVRTVIWAIRAASAYQALFSRYPGHSDDDEPFASDLCEMHTQWAHRLLAVCRNNRGLYVKAGQFASSFGSVPREYRNVLSGLEDRARPRAYASICQVLVEELGPVAESLFEHFDTTATAAASLAQVC